jgi:trigger factor
MRWNWLKASHEMHVRIGASGAPGRFNLSSVGTSENNDPQPEVAGPDTHEGHEHAPEGHDHEGHDHGPEGHEHLPGPVLNPECSRELIFDVPVEEVSKAYRTVAGNFRKYAKIPGFRAGKVPETVIRRRFEADIRKEVIDTLLPERFNKAVLEIGLRIVGQPQVTELTVEDGAPLHVKAIFEYLPDFSIEGYKEMTVPKPSAEVGEEDFQHEIESLRLSHAIIEPVEEDRPLAAGDWAQISYKGQIAGETESEPIAADDSLVEVGGEDTIPALTEALTGAKPGQQLKVEFSYPADYANQQLAGKPVAYEIEVKGIKKRVLPELTDDFAKEVGPYKSFAELETRIREHLALLKQRSVENDTRDRLFKAYAERFTFPVPESLVQDQIDTRLDRGLRALAAQGMTPDAMRQLDFNRLRTAQRESALAEVRNALIIDRIASEENITASDEEVEREIQIVAVQSREPVDALKARLNQEGGLGRVREQIRREKTASVLVERMPLEDAK